MFQSRRFLEIDQSETIIVCGSQVSVHLAKRFICWEAPMEGSVLIFLKAE
jgi:hypothetical protein